MSKNKKTFAQALEELEKIVTDIEQGQVSLEESIEKYAEGITLIEQCLNILDTAEKKIQLLTKGPGETLTRAGQLEEPEESQDKAI